MDCRMLGLPVYHQLPELTQTHVHQGGDAIRPSDPLSSLSLPAFNLSQHQGLFQWVGSFAMIQLFTTDGQGVGTSTSVSVFPINIQDWFPLGLTGWISLQSKGLYSLLQQHSSKESILQCSAFFRVQLSHPYINTGKTIALTMDLCWQNNVSAFEY